VFLLLHAGGSNAAQFQRQSAFDAEADAAGALAVYPQGLDDHWNDGRVRGDGALVHAGDDVGFVLALVDRLAAEGLADRAAVHAAGHSNGGMLALRLACEVPERLRSIAAVNANLPVDLACPGAARPLAALLVHATADRFMPIGGGRVGWTEGRLGRVLSAYATVSAFALRNGCTAPESRRLPASDGMPATVTVYRACRGAPLARVVVEGSGHGWPGSHYGARMTRQLGPTAQSFSATQAIAAFFREHRLPE